MLQAAGSFWEKAREVHNEIQLLNLCGGNFYMEWNGSELRLQVQYCLVCFELCSQLDWLHPLKFATRQFRLANGFALTRSPLVFRSNHGWRSGVEARRNKRRVFIPLQEPFKSLVQYHWLKNQSPWRAPFSDHYICYQYFLALCGFVCNFSYLCIAQT